MSEGTFFLPGRCALYHGPLGIQLFQVTGAHGALVVGLETIFNRCHCSGRIENNWLKLSYNTEGSLNVKN